MAPELLPLDQLSGFAKLADLSPSTVRALILRLRTNGGAIHLDGQQVGCALSSHLSALNHSCTPNAAATVQRGFLVVAAVQPVAPGEELTICYVDASAPVLARRAVLREHYRFDCACQRCRHELGEPAFKI